MHLSPTSKLGYLSFNFEGFHSPVYKNRTDSGGGVIIYSKSELSITERFDLRHPRLELV